jgi:hypothetical protein
MTRVVLTRACALVAQAEISSQYTVAGGPYYWAGALSGKLGRFPAYLQGAPPRTCYCAVLVRGC